MKKRDTKERLKVRSPNGKVVKRRGVDEIRVKKFEYA